MSEGEEELKKRIIFFLKEGDVRGRRRVNEKEN
jgi:hypothetical protein